MFTCIRDSFPIFDLIYFEMRDLYIVWLNAFQFSTCKVVFFFLFCVYLVLLLLYRIGNFSSYIAAVLVASFWGFQASMAEWLVQEIQIFIVADSNPTRSRFFANSRRISIFSYFT